VLQSAHHRRYVVGHAVVETVAAGAADGPSVLTVFVCGCPPSHGPEAALVVFFPLAAGAASVKGTRESGDEISPLKSQKCRQAAKGLR
jgi:hypothetical protein